MFFFKKEEVDRLQRLKGKHQWLLDMGFSEEDASRILKREMEDSAIRKLDDMIDNPRPASEYVRNLLKTYKNENSSQE